MIRFNDRVLVLGSTGSGKSELINGLFTDLHGGAQRLLVDTKGEFAIPGVEHVNDVDAIVWTEPIIHYRDRGDGPDEMQELFAVVRRRRRITVFVHEVQDLCEYNANRTPPAFNEVVSKGRGRGQGAVMGSQRCFDIPTRAKSEADHIFYFVPLFISQQDHKSAALAMGCNPDQLADQMEQVHEQLGEHAFVHFDRRARSVVACPPLSEQARGSILVQRPVLY